MKKLFLTTMLYCSSLMAHAQDAVVREINITSEAVKVAMEEFDQNSANEQYSLDIQIKNEKFNAGAKIVLANFEEKVRTLVLQPLSPLVGQYNRLVNSSSLGDSRSEVLTGLLVQIEKLAQEKSLIYQQAYLELYSALPDLPIMFINDHRDPGYPDTIYSESTKKNPLCMGLTRGCEHKYNYDFSIYFTRAKDKSYSLKNRGYYTDGSLMEFLKAEKILDFDSIKKTYAEDCFTSTCYLLSQSQYSIWFSLINSKLSRDITIKLNNGKEVSISRNLPFSKKVFVNSYLNHIPVGNVITDLPSDISPERLLLIKEFTRVASERSCKKAEALKLRLCQETQEGCLKESEKNFMKEVNKSNCL